MLAWGGCSRCRKRSSLAQMAAVFVQRGGELGRSELIGDSADRCWPNKGRATGCRERVRQPVLCFSGKNEPGDLVLGWLKAFVKVNGDGSPA